MFSGFPETLRHYGFKTDVRTLLDMYRTMEMGLVTSLGSLFDVCQHLICKSRREVAPYTLAFWDHFLGIDTYFKFQKHAAAKNLKYIGYVE